MIKIIGIDHLVLRTLQLEKMIFFYCDVLGCTIERKTATEIGLTQLRAGNALIDLVTVDSQLGKLGGGPPSRGSNNLDHFCLQIKTISPEALSKHLTDNGITLTDFSRRYGAQGYGDSLYIEDPDGNVVELKCQVLNES